YRDAGPLVEGPYDVYICGECIELCQSILEQEKRRRAPLDGSPQFPTIDAVVEALNNSMHGYHEAKRLLASVVHAHYGRLSRDAESHSAGQTAKTAILLVGPACSTRVLIMRVLSHAFGVPFAFGCAESLRAGTTNKWGSGNLFFDLLAAADFDLAAALHGILH